MVRFSYLFRGVIIKIRIRVRQVIDGSIQHWVEYTVHERWSCTAVTTRIIDFYTYSLAFPHTRISVETKFVEVELVQDFG